MSSQTTTRRPRAVKPKTVKTNVIFILDESGSMAASAGDVRGGFNTYVEQLRGDGNDYSLSAIKFGTKVRLLFANLPLDQVPQLSEANYTPLDSTALYDAIGTALEEARSQWGTKGKPYGKDRFLVVIMTDGEENASTQFTKEMIVGKIKRREAAGNWRFAYCGADQDAWANASGLGLASGNVLSYASGATDVAFASLATATSASASASNAITTNQTKDFFANGPITGNVVIDLTGSVSH